MKELSIEEKAKRFDEALEKIKELVSCGLIYEDAAIQVFHELKAKESEDEKIRNFISKELACLRATDEKGSDRYKELTEAIDWLKKQGEQNPAWSEEDENIRQWIISDIDKLLALRKKSFIIGDKEINWLKSLRPQSTWKPSDEQMEVLNWCKPLWNEPKTKTVLESLIKDLKNLREE